MEDISSGAVYEVRCVWCQVVTRYSTVEGSSGLCQVCYERLSGHSYLHPAQIDELPFGLIELDEAGTVRAYNRAEAELARVHPADVLGRNFFTEVAPVPPSRSFRDASNLFWRTRTCRNSGNSISPSISSTARRTCTSACCGAGAARCFSSRCSPILKPAGLSLSRLAAERDDSRRRQSTPVAWRIKTNFPRPRQSFCWGSAHGVESRDRRVYVPSR